MTNGEILLLFHLAFIAGCSLGWLAFILYHRNDKK